MIRKRLFHLLLIGMIVILIASTFSVLAASNTVPVSYAMDTTIPIDQNQFFPSHCAGMRFDNVIYGKKDRLTPITVIYGTRGNDLIFGTDGDDEIYGDNGHDCIVGGGGNNKLFGGNGRDVLIGGPGYDFIRGGNGQDICYFGEDVEECETIYY